MKDGTDLYVTALIQTTEDLRVGEVCIFEIIMNIVKVHVLIYSTRTKLKILIID